MKSPFLFFDVAEWFAMEISFGWIDKKEMATIIGEIQSLPFISEIIWH